MIVGFLFAFGNGSFSIEGALEPISGAGNVSRVFGLSQEESSCWNVIIAMEIVSIL
jgi:hypothetical protein